MWHHLLKEKSLQNSSLKGKFVYLGLDERAEVNLILNKIYMRDTGLGSVTVMNLWVE
jgi:hypothetical protein